MFQIVKVNGEFIKEEVDQGPALQVPSFVNNPARKSKRLCRLMDEEERRAAEEAQQVVNKVNMIGWSVACVMIGWIIAMI